MIKFLDGEFEPKIGDEVYVDNIKLKGLGVIRRIRKVKANDKVSYAWLSLEPEGEWDVIDDCFEYYTEEGLKYINSVDCHYECA